MNGQGGIALGGYSGGVPLNDYGAKTQAMPTAISNQPKENEITRELTILMNQSEQLIMTIKQLEERYSPVIAQRNADPLGPKEMCQCNTIIGKQLQEYNMRINCCIEALKYVIRQCEI